MDVNIYENEELCRCNCVYEPSINECIQCDDGAWVDACINDAKLTWKTQSDWFRAPEMAAPSFKTSRLSRSERATTRLTAAHAMAW